MLIKKKPTSPGIRHQLTINKRELYKNKLIKSLSIRKIKTNGRNNNGCITIRHRGGGTKKLIRKLSENLLNNSIVVGIEYDPNRTAFLARIFNLNTKMFGYVIATKNMYPGTLLQFKENENVDIKIGNRTRLMNLTSGLFINNILINNKRISTAAGTACQLIQKGPLFSKIKLPSGKIKNINSNAIATIGVISNEDNNLKVIGKAGKNRLKGKRPAVRGVAMNPVDHPHGGAGGKPSVTPWGKPTKGKPTKKCQNKSGN